MQLRIGLLLVTLAFAGLPSAHATFIGDLVYCDVNNDGVYDVGDGDFGLNDVEVTLTCVSNSGDICFADSTTTGPEVLNTPAIGILPTNCADAPLTWDPSGGPGETQGRYLFEIFNECGDADRPATCTVEVTGGLPPDCNSLGTPRVTAMGNMPARPVDTNQDGDFCDAQTGSVPPDDGPFPEGQALGNTPNYGGCEASPDPAPGDNLYTVIIGPGADECSIYNDFGFKPPAPQTPNIDIEKATNGADADDANAGDVPQIAPGDSVTWTYRVSNTGDVDFAEAEVVVTDDQNGVTPVLDSGSDVGGDLILSAGETWIYTAMSQALDLATAQGVTIVDGCNDGRPTYENMGTVAIDRFELMDTDPSHYCNPGEPDIDIRKQAEGSDSRTFASGSDVPFEIEVTNTGTVDLFNVVVTDILAPQCDRDIGFLAVADSVTYTCTAPDVTQSFTNEACVDGEDGDGTPVADCDPSTVEIPPPPTGGEGCTPGFWKQSQHFAAWLNPPYAPSTQFSDVFDNAFPGMTLLQVLKQGGGGLKALGRHTVAALLNAATADVSYDIGTPQGVIDAFNDVFPGSDSDYNRLKNEFESFNEQDCPINGKSRPSNL